MMETDGKPQRSLRILVIDDDADTRTSLLSLIRLWGYDGECAGTGRAALECATGPFDVVMLDLWLSDMDGCEVAREFHLRARGKRPYTIAITGCGLGRDFERTRAAGIDLHLVKPVDPKELLRVLGQIA